ncbi:MAG TPA: Flp pilus assembly protein CpaB [Euzebya sp.]|nr:Flp pilus assembly protein CpaB [Euzebya sp.]
MNPRQRRGVLLIALSVVGAVSVFVAASGFIADIQRQVGPLESVVQLTTDVVAFQPIPPEAVEVLEMPTRWRPGLALRSPAELQGMVPLTDLPAGTLLEAGDIAPPPDIGPGQRQIAILVDAETGVAGNIGVGDVVDIVATRAGFDDQPARAEIAIEGATILSIGTPQVEESVDPGTGAFATGQVVPITFVLGTADVLRLAYVESFATTVRLALRSPLEDDVLEPPERVYAPTSTTGDAP